MKGIKNRTIVRKHKAEQYIVTIVNSRTAKKEILKNIVSAIDKMNTKVCAMEYIFNP